MRTSTRRGISYPLADRSDPADIPTHLANLVNALDLDTPFYSGTFAAIPAVGSVVQGSWYWATDQSQLYHNNGTTWGAVLTGSTLGLTGDITARSGTGTAVKIGNAGPASQSGISFSNAEDYLYRDAANSLTLQGNTQITFKIGTTTQSGILNVMGQTAAGLRLQSFVASEANPRFTIRTDGLHAWGPGGATATDTNLYRNSANNLQTDGAFWVGNGLVVDALSTGTRLYFGGALDTSLYRWAAGWLGTDSILVVNNTTGIYTIGNSGGVIRHLLASGDVNPNFVIDYRGILNWGPGGAIATDTTLGRSSPGILDLSNSSSGANGGMRIFTPAAASSTLGIYKTTDAQPSFQIVNDGRLNWGPGGSTALDTNLYRGASGDLRTDSIFRAGNAVIVDQGNSGSKLYFGSALDTALYRLAAGVVQTDRMALAGNSGFALGSTRALTINRPYAAGSALDGLRVQGVITTSIMSYVDFGVTYDSVGYAYGALAGNGNEVLTWDASGSPGLNGFVNIVGTTKLGFGGTNAGTAPDTYVARSVAGQLSLNNKLLEGNAAITNISASATFTPNLSNGLIHRVAATSGAAITLTIGAPTNPPSGTQTALLIVHIGNSSAGTITIAWNAAFLPGGTLALPASLPTAKTTEVLFVWDGANWRIVSIG